MKKYQAKIKTVYGFKMVGIEAKNNKEAIKGFMTLVDQEKARGYSELTLNDKTIYFNDRLL